ncbi:MAG: hypothetical protein PHX34_05865 [Candidatus Shapirobacteria bacterium]|nr:hypothetical protein [Candidatus Shapirobacteria bacterium]
MNVYNFILIFVITFILYFLSLFLVKKNKFNQINHRRFWNIILLVTFLVSGLLGLILAFSIDQKISLNWYQPFLWLHVEFGIIMALVSIFHIFWHLSYFKSMLKSRS